MVRFNKSGLGLDVIDSSSESDPIPSSDRLDNPAAVQSKWICYHVPPIDAGWNDLETVYAVIDRKSGAITSDCIGAESIDATSALKKFLGDWKSVCNLAFQLGFTGKFRLYPCVLWLPDNKSGFGAAFVLKLDENGFTYVFSPVELHWLARYCCYVPDLDSN
jgi:hypothetical protein